MHSIPLDDLRSRLQAYKGRFPEIAQRSGLSYSLICKLGQGARTNPTLGTVQSLVRALDALEAEAAAAGTPNTARVN